jgi:hypothetical protein
MGRVADAEHLLARERRQQREQLRRIGVGQQRGDLDEARHLDLESGRDDLGRFPRAHESAVEDAIGTDAQPSQPARGLLQSSPAALRQRPFGVDREVAVGAGRQFGQVECGPVSQEREVHRGGPMGRKPGC